MFIQTIRIEVGTLLGLEKDEEAYIVLKELTTLEVINFRNAYNEGESAVTNFFKEILPTIIVDHNFYETENFKMTNEAVADLIFERIELSSKVMQNYSNACFFYPSEEDRMHLGSLCDEVFNGRYSQELFAEYGKWLPYITDVFLPCCNTENGDLLHLPFEGGIMDQPYMTMQIVKVIQLSYRQYLSKKQKEIMSKHKTR